MSPSHYWNRLGELEGVDCPECEDSDPRECSECGGTGSVTDRRAAEIYTEMVNWEDDVCDR